MRTLRGQFGAYPRATAFLLAATLLLRLLVPAGFMPIVSSGGMQITLCTGSGPQSAMIDMAGMATGKSKPDGHPGQDVPCGFAGVAMPGLVGADPLPLAPPVVLAITTTPAALPIRTVRRVPRLRPPLRGPPGPR